MCVNLIGTLSSLDDFYSISSGLAATETTLRVFSSSLLQLIQPVGQIWEPVRYRCLGASQVQWSGGQSGTVVWELVRYSGVGASQVQWSGS